MLNRALATVMRLGRAGGFLVGLAVIVVVLGSTTAVVAGNGDPLKLGQKNTASKLTTLVGKVASGATLLVRNSGGGPALDLRVNAGEAPLGVNSNGLVSNLNADAVDGKSASAFVANSIYKRESAVAGGTALGDGTHSQAQACDNGDVLLTGGPANINPTSTLLESFPSAGTTTSWTVRINKNGQADNFSVVILCANQ